MKKINFKPINAIAIIACSILLSGGCSKDNSTEEFLDLNLTNFNQTKAGSTSGTANLNQLTPDQARIYYAAIKRLKPHVTKLNGQYVMNVSCGSEVQISERLFSYYKQNFQNFNKIRNKVLKDGNKFVEIRPNKFLIVPKDNNFNFILTKGGDYGEGEGEEDPLEKPGGTTDVFFHFWTTELYLSYSFLSELKMITGGTTVLAGALSQKVPAALLLAVPEAAMIALATAIASGLINVGIGYLMDNNPNGIIITFSNILVGTITDIKGQNPLPDNN